VKLGLHGRALTTAVAVSVTSLATLALLTVSIERERAAADAASRAGRAVAAATALETSVLGAESGLDAYLIARTSSSLEPYHGAVQVHDYQLNELFRLGTATPAEQHLVMLLTIGTDDYFHGWAVPLLALAQTDPAAARAQVIAGVGQQRLEDLRSRFAVFTALEQRNRADAAARAAALGTLAEAIGLAGLLIIGLLALGSVVVIKRFVASPIRRLIKAGARVGEGDLSARVPGDAVAEVGELERGFNRMTELLKHQRDEVESQNAELEAQQVSLEHALDDLAAEKLTVERLVGFAGQLAAETEVVAAMQLIVDGMASAAGAELGALYVLEEEEDSTLRVGAWRGFEASELPASLPRADSTFALGQERVIRTDAESARRLAPGRARKAQHGLSIPLYQGTRLLGVVGLGRLKDTPFSQADTSLLARMADQSSIALANVTSYARATRLASLNRTLIDAVVDGIRLVGLDGTVITENRRWAELAPGPAGVATTGSHWEQAEAAADRMLNPAAFRAGLEEIRANPATPTEHEFEVAESGQVIRRFTSPVHDQSGRRIGRIVVLREMTGERRLQRMKDEFVATVTHELRTPLTSIAGYVELLLDGEGGPVTDDQRKFLRVIERNSERLLHLVSDLLFVARVEAGMLELEVEELRLDTLVEDAVEAARPAAESHQLTLDLATGDVPALGGDEARLGQLVDNLLSNAIKFTPAGGTISVKTGAGPGVAFVTVSDTGIGIPDEEKASLFHRFFRASTATDAAIAGTGLGLSIAKAIAEAHSGSISVEDAPGGGTLFRVELPLPAASSAAAAA
jgi:signal transduction histidine kinase/HAMP domain-containing protein